MSTTEIKKAPKNRCTCRPKTQKGKSFKLELLEGECCEECYQVINWSKTDLETSRTRTAKIVEIVEMKNIKEYAFINLLIDDSDLEKEQRAKLIPTKPDSVSNLQKFLKGEKTLYAEFSYSKVKNGVITDGLVTKIKTTP
jgi:hypothetical protein